MSLSIPGLSVANNCGCRVSFASEDKETSSLEFSSESVPWGKAYETIDVTFGSSITNDDFDVEGLRQQPEILKRQDQSTFTAELLKNETNYPSLSTQESSSTSAKTDIGFSVLDKQLTQGVKCIDCSVLGEISIQGTSDSASSGWSLAASASGVSAHVEIEMSLSKKESMSFNIPLHTIDLDSFQIGTVAVVSSKVVLEVVGGIFTIGDLDIDISWGFDVKVSEKLKISVALNTDQPL